MTFRLIDVAVQAVLVGAFVGCGLGLRHLALRHKRPLRSIGWNDLTRTLQVAILATLLATCYLQFFRVSKQVAEAQIVHDVAQMSIDIEHYYDASRQIAIGKTPWRDFFFEYPPTSAYLVSPPALAQPNINRKDYSLRYVRYIGLLLTIGTLIIGGLWLRFGRTAVAGFALIAWIYGVTYMGHLTFLRMEPIIGLLTMAGLTALLCQVPRSEEEHCSSTQAALAGLLLGLASAKLYPLLLVVSMIPALHARKRLGIFAVTFGIGLLPILIPALLGPEGSAKFLSYHGDRHFEIGSLYSVLFQNDPSGHLGYAFGSLEWRFDSEATVGKVASLLTLCGTLGPLALLYFRRCTDFTSAMWAGLASLAGFVLFNKVGSPQYATWLLSAIVCGALLRQNSKLQLKLWIVSVFAAYLFTRCADLQMGHFHFEETLFETFLFLRLKVLSEVVLTALIMTAFAISLRSARQPLRREIGLEASLVVS